MTWTATGANLRLKVKRQGQWERKCNNRFSRIFSSKADRFTSNQDRSGQISSNTFHQRKRFVCVIICNAVIIREGRLATCCSVHLLVLLQIQPSSEIDLVDHPLYSRLLCCHLQCMNVDVYIAYKTVSYAWQEAVKYT